MIKRVTLYSLKEGTDPDEMWKWHTQVHTADFLNIVGERVKKYVVNRVTKVLSGEPRYWGMVETWWENRQIMNETYRDTDAFKSPDGKTFLDDWWARVASGSTTLVDEVTIKDNPDVSGMIKKATIYSLQAGVDRKEWWQWQTGVHASDFVKIGGPRLQKYVVNMATDLIYGEPKFVGLIETWYKNEADIEETGKIESSFKAADGKNFLDDWESKGMGVFSTLLDVHTAEI